MLKTTIHQIALGKKSEKGTLAVRKSETGTGSLQEDIKASIFQEKGSETIQVEMDSIDRRNVYRKIKEELSWYKIAEKTIEVYKEVIADAK